MSDEILSRSAFSKEWDAIEATGWSWALARGPVMRAHDEALRADRDRLASRAAELEAALREVLDAILTPSDPDSDQLPVPEQTTAEPDRCPTCESVDQTKCGNPRYPQHDHGAFPLCCPDPWHRAPYDDEGYVAYQDLGEWLGILPAAEPEVGP